MNLKFLGDVKDWWKGAVFTYLQAKGVLRPLQVIPMFTDKKEWGKLNLAAYARLLHVGKNDILEVKPFINKVRVKYFSSVIDRIEEGKDLFLDPDTGFDRKGSKRHAKPEDAGQLLTEGSDMVVVVYQHRQRKKEWELNQLKLALKGCPGSHGLALSSGNAALLFFSMNSLRIGRVRRALKKMVGENLDKRLFPTSDPRKKSK